MVQFSSYEPWSSYEMGCQALEDVIGQLDHLINDDPLPL
jgi:hypothetical protein